jgi:hypothetical protein
VGGGSGLPAARYRVNLCPMPERDLQALVRRRLWELAQSPEDNTRSARWTLAAETVQRMARDQGRTFINESIVPLLARALVVTENRVRAAAGLPVVPDPRENITTRPHLRVLKDGDLPPPPPHPRSAPADSERSTAGPHD